MYRLPGRGLPGTLRKRLLASVGVKRSPKPVYAARGKVAAHLGNFVRFPRRRVARGSYVFAIRLSAEHEPDQADRADRQALLRRQEALVQDSRVEKLAELLTGYSLGLKEGQVFRVDGEEAALPLIVAAYRWAIRRGALAYSQARPAGLDEILLEDGNEKQLSFISPAEQFETEELDAWLTLWSSSNTRALTRMDPERRKAQLAAHYRMANRRWQRISAGELSWCGTLFPTQAHAQDAEMSLAEYEDFVYGACHVEDDDPIAHWESVSAELTARAAQLEGVRELRIVGPDTDLRIGVEGRPWIPSDGRQNMPDGEIFTSPVETETEGDIYFAFPSIFQGREVENVRLRFEGGRWSRPRRLPARTTSAR